MAHYITDTIIQAVEYHKKWDLCREVIDGIRAIAGEAKAIEIYISCINDHNETGAPLLEILRGEFDYQYKLHEQ